MYINRFNAERIRRRMREQSERFGPKGKPSSSKQVFSLALSPEPQFMSSKKDLPHTISLSPPQSLEVSHEPQNPGLTIAVTMSEDGDDSPTKDETKQDSDESMTGNNESVWAMMEHYQQGKEDASPNVGKQPRITTEQSSFSLFDSSLAYESYSFQSEDSERSINDKDTNVGRKVFALKQVSQIGKTPIKTPSKIEEDDDCYYSSDEEDLQDDDYFPNPVVESGVTEMTYAGAGKNIKALDGFKAIRQEAARASLSSEDSKENFAYLAKIEELEQNLKEQRHTTDNVQSKLKDRVVELEQALRATAATPRGTIVQENPLKTLLDRNQTLVKEVRFADQTCVELSSKNSALEAEKAKLQEQILDLEEENDLLRKENQAKEDAYTDESVDQEDLIRKLTEDLRLANETIEHLKMKTSDQAVQSSVLQDSMVSDENLDSTMTSSSDIVSVESSKIQSENDFLGRQLGSVQERLDQKTIELEDERKKSRTMEDHWRVEVQKHLSKIETLEKLSEQKNQSSPQLDVEMLQEALFKLYSHYKNLDNEVKDVVDGYVDRLERLTFAVEHLRSNLLFEAESVLPEKSEEISYRMMNPNIDSNQNSNKEDKMLELMEEARSPPKSRSKQTDVSSDFGDMTLLFSDDATLDTINKTGSIASSPMSPALWKEPLDAAIKECQRVRERSSKLKKEIENKVKEIKNLEIENGKLSLEVSRTAEEKIMVEKAFNEAKEMIRDLESSLDLTTSERDKLLAENQALEENLSFLKKSEKDMEIHLSAEQKEQGVLLRKILGLEQTLNETKVQLDAVTETSTDYKTKYDNLLINFERKALAVTEQKNLEITHIQQYLKQTESDNILLKASYQEMSKKITVLQEENTEYQKLVTELEALKQKVISDSEDQVLESQYNLEAIRSDRAELRSKLSMAEKESTSLKESLKSYKARAESQLEKKTSEIQKFQSEQSELCLHFEELAKERRSFFDFLVSIGFCTAAIRDISIAEEASSGDTGLSKCAKEFSYWKEILPSLSETVHILWKNKADFEQLRQEAESLNEDVSTLRDMEDNYKKQIEDERQQNERFNELFSQAELEMERSANQIREMSIALSTLQQKESEATKKVKLVQNELVEANQDFQRAQNEMNMEQNKLKMKIADLTADLEIKERRLSEMNVSLLTTKADLERVSKEQKSGNAEEKQLRSVVDSLETKCSRLRDYIKKLTKKCEEWEVSYDQQVSTIEKLQAKNLKIREKASEVAGRYHRLKEDIQKRKKSHKDDKIKWTHERSTIHEVHARLEEELELITKELDG